MSRVIPVATGSLVVLALIVAPAAYAVRQQARTRNLHVVRPGVLYRSGQMTKDGLARILADYHIRTVVNLRDGSTPQDRAEEAFCHSEEVNFVRILPNQWGDVGGSVPVEEGVRKFRAVMSDPRNYPVLVHCFAGIHRTGAYCAIYRMERERWSNADAIAEVKACGYTKLDEELDILGFLEQYRPSWMPKPQAPPAEAKAKPKHRASARRKSAPHVQPDSRSGKSEAHRPVSQAARLDKNR